MSVTLSTHIQYLKGVGPKLGDLLSSRGISTVADLLEYYPRAFEDRRAARNIASLKLNETVSFRAQILKVNSIPMGRTRRRMYDLVIRDSSGQVHCKFFRVPYKGYFERFAPFTEVRVTGKVIDYRGRLELHHPDVREFSPEDELQDVLVPIYPEIENLTSAKISRLIRQAAEQMTPEAWGRERFPESLRKKYELIPRREALLLLHQPEPEMSQQMVDQKSPAHRRIIFEEFFWLELFVAAKKMGLEREKAIPMAERNQAVEQVMMSLPFQLTGAQRRSFAEIRGDLLKPHPMHRMVQGDVGSGKTLVAFLAAAFVYDNGFQSCLMAPTEILAEQHFRNAVKVLQPLGLAVALLTGKTKAAEREQILERLAAGSIHFLIGTHALIEDAVVFAHLSLVIIDEQHRFGVEQRGRLKAKGLSPHFLVMTATPIPRTLALTVYGDLVVSVIDEMPPGRSPIQTRAVFQNKRPEALDFLAKQVERGRQAYVVYPLVEESEKLDLKNAVDEFSKLQQVFPKYRIGLLHGKMKSIEKDEVMAQFYRGEIQILVTTTVIEVGVDVPNANIMMVEHAERFGLSQLHQLRGRVGRGEHKSFCILLMGHAVSEEGRARTRIMEETTDGFKIAEFDLEMRGPGEFLGTRQSGLQGFKMANLVRDVQLLQEARDAAFELLSGDKNLKKPENVLIREELLRAYGPSSLASIA
jgi:ATP-dependent DNA helicase RecG